MCIRDRRCRGPSWRSSWARPGALAVIRDSAPPPSSSAGVEELSLVSDLGVVARTSWLLLGVSWGLLGGIPGGLLGASWGCVASS
eukprot:3716877-Pyramimonas_sp.AAC.1